MERITISFSIPKERVAKVNQKSKSKTADGITLDVVVGVERKESG